MRRKGRIVTEGKERKAVYRKAKRKTSVALGIVRREGKISEGKKRKTVSRKVKRT